MQLNNTHGYDKYVILGNFQHQKFGQNFASNMLPLEEVLFRFPWIW